MTKTKREQARELALKLNQVIIDSDEDITSDVLLCACSILIGTITANAGETERDVVRDMTVFGEEVRSVFQSCRTKHATTH